MFRTLILTLGVAIIAVPVAIRAAQNSPSAASEQTTTRRSFDVTSIKERAPGDMNFAVGIRVSPGRVTSQCANLKALISFAYNLVPLSPVAGLPDWATAPPGGPDNYEVQATMPADATRGQAAQMMQSLLAERFKLAVHWEKRDTPVYALVIASGGFKLKPADPRDPPIYGSSFKCPEGDARCNILPIDSATISNLGDMISPTLRRIVVDRTGLTEKYHLGLIWAGNDSIDSPLPTLPTALKEKFGLELKSVTAPVDALVVDHAEKPTSN